MNRLPIVLIGLMLGAGGYYVLLRILKQIEKDRQGRPKEYGGFVLTILGLSLCLFLVARSSFELIDLLS